MRKFYGLLILLFLLSSLTWAVEQVKLTNAPDAVSVQVLESTGDRILVQFRLNHFLRDEVMVDGARYDFIWLDDEARIWEKGAPDLPRLCRSVIIPDDGLMEASIVSAEYRDFSGMNIPPSKGHLLRSVNPADVPLEFGEVYRKDAWYPEKRVNLRDPYIMRDLRGQVIELNTFQYNPVTQTLRVYTDVIVEVKRVGTGGANILERRHDFDKVSAEFRKIYERHFINWNALDYTPVDEQGTLLVICYDPWVNAVMPLVDWKNQKGIATTIVPVGQIGNDPTSIKNFIEGEYYTNDLTWVLLVGDAAQVATPSGGEDPTYGQIVGNDSYFELFVGRFSAENLDHVNTQVERTVEYERDPQLGADWYHKGIGIASDQGPGHHGEYDFEHMDLIRDQLLHYGYTEVDQVYDPYATQSMITNALNEGRGIGNYCGHGSTTSWGTTGFNNANINNLVNDNMLPFITSVACLNGNFAGSTCFGEAWLRATHNGEPTGAIGFWGSSISQSWSPPMDAQDEVIDLLTPELKMTFGGLCFNGAMLMIDLNGATGANEADHWTIFGDPSVQVWAKTPEAMTVSHDNQIDISASSFEVVVSGVEGALAAISWDGELFGSAYTDPTGLASIPLVPGTLPPNYVTLTVTAFNKIPYIVQLPVVSGGPDLYPPLIAHIPLESTTSAGPYTVSATIMDYSGVASASVFYSTDGINFDEAAMANVGGDTWEGDIPGQSPGTVVDYYIEAVDASPQANVGQTETWSFNVLAVLFFDDMESGMGDWTHEPVSGTWQDQWHLSTANSYSGSYAWKFGDTGAGNYANLSDGVLISPVITIGSDCELTFWHWIAAEQSGTYPDSAYDGGVVEISLNGGPWGVLLMNYTHTVRSTAGGGNPYTGPFPPGTPLFSGNSNWSQVTADLSNYVGDIQLRFRFGSDASANDVGWFIDDVQIIGLPTGTLPDLVIELTYVSGSPVPASGGNLDFGVFVENQDNTALDFDAWLDIAYEGGAPTTVVQRSFTDFQPGWQINRPDAFFPVPGSYAAGNYTMTGRVGVYPSAVWDESGFPFVKSGTSGTANFAPFIPTQGFPNPFDIISTGAETTPIPEEFIVLGNYPNPFNPTTTFEYALPERDHVVLNIFDLQGRLVNTLVDGLQDAGIHRVVFDAAHLASGIYLYRLSAGHQTISGKMVLLK